MEIEALLTAARAADISLIRFLYCDNNGLIRGKGVPLPRLATRLADGVGLPKALMAVNSFDELQPVSDMTPVGEVRLVPDPATFTTLPYAPHHALLLCDLIQQDGAPWPACPRTVLKRVCQQAADQGLQLQAAFEVEFTLTRLVDGRYEPFGEPLCYNALALQTAAAFAHDLVTAVQAQRLEVELFYPELGAGQYEISIHQSDGVTAADNLLKLRETIRGVARQHDLYASLAPKPFTDSAGNGAHIHVSLWDSGGRNIFYDPAAVQGFSSRGLAFLAGVRRHLPGLTALTCASVNSYRRLTPQSLSGAFAAYGYDNREVALRIPSPFWSNPEHSTNLELKAADASANPYLALAGLLAAGLAGLVEQPDPGEPVACDPALLTDDQRENLGISRLPTSLAEATDALAADALLTATLGPLLTEAYLAVKRSEVLAYQEYDVAYELANHFYKF